MTLDSQLEKLTAAQLLRRADDQDLAYVFKHTLTQETTYQSLLQRRRREVHRRVAEAYEREYTDRLPQYAAILAQHYAQAGDDFKTLTFAFMAGDEAARVYSNPEAISHYTLALEAAKKRGGDRSAPLEQLYLKRGRVMEVSNQYAGALENYKEMERVGQEHSDLSLLLASLIAQALVLSIATPLFDPVKGQELSDRALALARDLADRKAEAKILWSLMLLCYFTNRMQESVKYGEQSMAIARELDLREQLAFTLSDISRSYMGVGRVERALDSQAEARVLWRELGNLPLLADNLTNSAGVHYNRGELDLALKLAGEALTTARSIGNLWGESFAEQMLAVLHADRGEIGESFLLIEDSIRLAEQIGALFALPSGYAFLSWGSAKLGDSPRALEYGRLAVAKGEQLFRPFLPFAYAVQGYAYLLNGNLAEAEVFVAKSHQDLDPRNFDFPQPFFVAIVEAEVAFAKGEHERAMVVLDEIISTLRELGIRVFLAELLLLKSRVLEAIGQADEARAVLAEAREIAESIGQNLILIPILAALSRLETGSGDGIRGPSLRQQARELVQAIARNVPPDLRDTFLKLPDTVYVMDGE